jgi:O-antigen ligase
MIKAKSASINNILIYVLIILSFASYEYSIYRSYYQFVIALVLSIGALVILVNIQDHVIISKFIRALKTNWIVHLLSIALMISTLIASLRYSIITFSGLFSVVLTIFSIYIYYLFMPIVMVNIEHKITKLVHLITFFSIIGIVIFLRGSFINYSFIYSRVASIFFDSNYFGTLCSIGVVLSINKKGRFRIITLINLVGLYLSGSRGAMISLLVTLVLSYFYKKKIRIKSLLLFSVLGIVIYYFMIFLYNSNFFRVYQGLSHRDQLWKIALSLITKEPLSGYGYGSVSTMMRMQGALNGSSHNAFLDYILMYGIPVFFLNVIIIIKSLYNGVKNEVPKEFLMVIFVLIINSNTISINLGGLGATSLLLTIFLGLCNTHVYKTRPLQQPIMSNLDSSKVVLRGRNQ